MKAQSPTIDLFNYYYSLSSSLEAKKSMVWSCTFVKRRIQNPLKDIFQGKSLLVKQLED